MLPTTSQKVQRGHPDRVVGLRRRTLMGGSSMRSQKLL